MAQPLPPEAIAEVLVRLPPAEPASVFRASAVSRSWHELVWSEYAIRRYREHHRVPPVLGFYQNQEEEGEDDNLRPRFVPSSIPCPPFAEPQFNCVQWLALDCRHGRLLVYAVEQEPEHHANLRVWNPINGHQDIVELPSEYDVYGLFTGAVFCAADGCNHLDCAGGPYRIVFIPTADDAVEAAVAWASVYSSETGVWTVSNAIQPGALMDGLSVCVLGPGLLLSDTVYFSLDLRQRRVFLAYRVTQNTLSVLEAPPAAGRDMVVVITGDRLLGVASLDLENSLIKVWSRPTGDGGVWTLSRTIRLDPAIRQGNDAEIHLVGHAEGTDFIFISGDGDVGVTMVDLKSGKGKKLSNLRCRTPVFPYAAFFTNGLGAGFHG